MTGIKMERRIRKIQGAAADFGAGVFRASAVRDREEMNELLPRLPSRYDQAAERIKHGRD